MINTIKTTITESTTHNFKQYDAQCVPQPAYIYADTRTGEIWSDYSSDFGNGCSPDVWHGMIQIFSIPAWLTTRSINELMIDMQDDIEKFLNSDYKNDEGDSYNCLAETIKTAAFGLEQLEQNEDGEYIDENGNCLE